MPEITILIPMLGRPERAQIVASSIHEHTQIPYEIVFLCNGNDEKTARACLATGARMFYCDDDRQPGDYARKINYGFQSTESPWVFLGASDLDFTDGWDTAALHVAGKTDVGVIGTNDGANPLVIRGRHSTHSFVKRRYIEDVGGTWHDGPGVVYSGAYDHQFVDNELVQAAQDRSEWAFSKQSLVKHLHPFYGGLKMDETYKTALAHGREDAAIFLERQRQARPGRRGRR